jgi:hypothetical protein
MTRTTLIQHHRTISILASGLALLLVLILAPRMEGPRVLFGITFTTKTGTPGLMNLGWALLILMPLLTYFATDLVLRLMKRKGKQEE